MALVTKSTTAAALIFFAACSTKSGGAKACQKTSDCASIPGDFCIAGSCVAPCSNNSSCTNNQVCQADGSCGKGVGGGQGPSITSLAGDGTGGVISNGIVVKGLNLGGATAVKLTDAALTVLGELTIGTAAASQITAAIPAELATQIEASSSHAFFVQVETAGGVARAAATVLQGAIGPQGVAGADAVFPQSPTSAQATPTLTISNTGTGPALAVTQGTVDFAAVPVKLPIRTIVNRQFPPHLTGFTISYAACAANEMVIGGGCGSYSNADHQVFEKHYDTISGCPAGNWAGGTQCLLDNPQVDATSELIATVGDGGQLANCPTAGTCANGPLLSVGYRCLINKDDSNFGNNGPGSGAATLMAYATCLKVK